MRIEGEKGVKTQSAKTLAADAQKKFGREISNRIEPVCSAGSLARQTRPQRARTRRKQAAIGRNVSERTDRAGRSGKHARPRPNSLAKRPTKSLDRDKIHRPSAQILGQAGKTQSVAEEIKREFEAAKTEEKEYAGAWKRSKAGFVLQE
ncbi:unnamed protein product [Microthlaspi erraticum]|uniref:Uncharacterized protein n=1 Tax=Microthlaspi erraticum TaxID=1685480 RepID=A0A6D2HT57_9BRAS|nr:unnamed protein product [Microthlaspi erraticum]